MRKRNVNVGLILILAALFAPFALLAQQATTTPVIIRVSDQSGAGIAHARIRLMPSSGLTSPDQVPAKLETDDHGQCAINLKAGGYALAVSAPVVNTCPVTIYMAEEIE